MKGRLNGLNTLGCLGVAFALTACGVSLNSNPNGTPVSSASPQATEKPQELPSPSPSPKLVTQAGTQVPVGEILQQLKDKTQVPILLPNQIPTSEKVYFQAEGKAEGYTITIGYTPNCQATACIFGEIRAEKNGQFSEKLEGVTKTLKDIQLAKNVKGIFHNGCGASCTASAEWKDQGVLYVVAIKNGQEADVIKIANSAIEAGKR